MKELAKNLKRVYPFVKTRKVSIIIYTIINLLKILTSIVLPILSAQIIIELTNNELKQVLYVGLAILCIELSINVLSYFSRIVSRNIYITGMNNIQTELGKEILKIENKCLDETSTGVFIQRLTNDSSRLADVISLMYENVSQIITDVGIFIAIFIINKKAFIFIAINLILLFLFQLKRANVRKENDKKYRKEKEKVSGFIGELVKGTRDIKMLNAEESFIKELDKEIIKSNDSNKKLNTIDANYLIALGSYRDFITFGIVALIIYLIHSKEIAVATALVIYNYSNRIMMFMYMISNFMINVKDYNLSAERIFSIIESKDFEKEHFGSRKIKKVNGDFEFKNVTFGYKENVVLNNINFKVNANETVAFVGKSGAGKTTIFNLLTKMYDNKEGLITIDGIDINELDKDSIRGNITVISQNPYIFNMSIKDNLRLVKENATDKEIEEACRLACLEDFIETLPEKYDTVVGEGGVSLSGGQRQRLAIARALIQKTEIILFDEATSALDNETQSKIQEAIDNMKNEYTILIIAHRLSTIKNCDRILFLNDGKIECEGTHEELMKNCKNYKDLYEKELNTEKKLKNKEI